MNINPIMTPTTVPRSDNSTAGSEIIDQEPAINLQYTNSLSARTPEEVSDKQSDCTLSDDEMGSKEADAGFEFRHQFDDLYNGFHNPYNPLSEETPKLPAYHPSFFLAEVYCGEILAEALELLKSSGYRDGVIRGVIDRILTDLRVEYPSPRRIGLIGDSGVGKSSLINSMLDTPDLAIEGSSGSACTCVITEFHQAEENQTSPFMAEILLYEVEQIEIIMLQYFKDYYRFMVEPKDNKEQDLLDEEESHSASAADAFVALFANRDEFKDENSTRAFFATAESTEDEAIVEKMMMWIIELTTTFNADSNVVRITADTANELGRKIEPFIKTCSSFQDEDDSFPSSSWPIVKLVRIGLQSNFLDRGIVVVDLPGLSDVNKIRVKTTHEYIRECHSVYLVSPIARVQTNNLVHQRLLEFSKTFGTKKALICTKIDDMPKNVNPKDVAVSTESLKRYQRISHIVEAIDTKKVQLQTLERETKGREKQRFGRKLRTLCLRRKVWAAIRREALVTMRNQKVISAFKTKYKNLASDLRSLDVWCVSNTAYSTHKIGYDDEDIPLSLTTTGIPALRTLISRYPATGRLNVLKYHCESTVPGIVGSMEMWSLGGSIPNRAELRKIVESPIKESEVEVWNYFEEIGDLLETCILAKIRASQADWTRCGLKSFKKWASWHPRTFHAWCQHDGLYSTKTKSHYSWNNDLVKPIYDNMTETWQIFEEKMKEAMRKCYKSLVTLLETIRENLRAIEGVSMTPMAPFMESLARKNIDLRKELYGSQTELKKLCRNVKLDLTIACPSSFISRSMTPIYQRCAELHGKNRYSSQCALLEYCIERGDAFNRMAPGVKLEMKAILTTNHEKLHKGVQAVFDSILADFDCMFVVEELPSPEREVLRQQVHDFVQNAKAKINGPVMMELATAIAESS